MKYKRSPLQPSRKRAAFDRRRYRRFPIGGWRMWDDKVAALECVLEHLNQHG